MSALNLATITGNAYQAAAARKRRIADLAEPFEKAGSIIAPAYGVQAVVCTYEVPHGYCANLTGIMCVFEGGQNANFIPGSGDIVWSIDVNTPLGFPLATAYTIQDFERIVTPKGDYAHLWPVNRWEEFEENDTLRFKVLTVQNVATGVGTAINCVLHGTIWPKD